MGAGTGHVPTGRPDGVGRPLEAAFAAELAAVRPELGDAFAEALPRARSAVLGRLWRALLYEPLPGVAGRDAAAGVVRLDDGRRLSGPPRLPHDLDRLEEALTLRLDGRPHTHPAGLLAAVALPGAATLTAELDHSVASLALSLAGAAAPPRASVEPPGADEELAHVEQGVVDGHPYHPCCRSRPGFSVAEQLAYGPEHRPVVGVDLAVVPADRCRVVGEWPARLRDGDRLLLPVHPWQAAHVLPELGGPPLRTGAIPARPLMSVRSFAPLAGGPHLKTALSMRLTSQVRDISAGSVANSAALSALLTRVVERLERLDGSLRITRNLGAVSAVVHGVPSPDLAVLLRESPSEVARLGAGERVLPVAALAARPAAGGPPLIHTLLGSAGVSGVSGVSGLSGSSGDAAVDWLGAFARLLLPPLLRLLDWGVALAAHGQNLLVVLDAAARPRRFVYRDLADGRVSSARLGRLGFTPPPLGGRAVEDDPAVLRTRLYGDLLGSTLSALVAALGAGERSVEARLWAAVAAAAREAFEELPATARSRADRAALFGDEVRVKALTTMRLEGVAGERWMSLPNPLA
ncbi:IucA/IucC family siderophore biosynthesis protein [Streptomyces sp. LX-29]|uniref:IucA/IucC family protein n=1 Tax=Streptomyces sp. LX-29 TaxID=2900152 RepID=UPI00240CE7E4|nr:IucA/IucC family siderophore biosynthesis protein [Streptomyces sp. LX-29]WFB08912.1 IucA/IucC family siderophore biosynthesis protein [Streptomyces sp. LX-29]